MNYINKMKKESIRKLKFYDITLLVCLISSIVFFGIFFITEYPLQDGFLYWIEFISIFSLLISLGIITWGMIYHEFKNKNYIWLVFTLLTFLIGVGGFIVSIIFYIVKMRWEFKKGRGVYEKE